MSRLHNLYNYFLILALFSQSLNTQKPHTATTQDDIVVVNCSISQWLS